MNKTKKLSENNNEENDSSSEISYEDIDDTFIPVSDFNIINTNARSLTPKINSFVEYLKELETSLAFITETWLSDLSLIHI